MKRRGAVNGFFETARVRGKGGSLRRGVEKKNIQLGWKRDSEKERKRTRNQEAPSSRGAVYSAPAPKAWDGEKFKFLGGWRTKKISAVLFPARPGGWRGGKVHSKAAQSYSALF